MRPTRTQSLAGVALLLILGQTPALAATINVTGGCKLVDAITAANTDNAIGLCKAGRGKDTIVLPANSTHTLTTVNNSTPYGPTGLRVVTIAINIAGNGSTVTRATGAPAFRIVAVSSTGNLTIQRTTASGGATSSGSGRRGGGVFNKGKLTLSNSTVSGNTAGEGAGVYTGYGSVTLANSSVSGNKAAAAGGVYICHGAAVFNNSAVSGNTAQVTSGGGVMAEYSQATFTNSTVSGNKAFVAGGISSFKSRVNLTNSTVSGNTAVREGGGIFNTSGIMSLINTTVSGNAAGTLGGGVIQRWPLRQRQERCSAVPQPGLRQRRAIRHGDRST